MVNYFNLLLRITNYRCFLPQFPVLTEVLPQLVYLTLVQMLTKTKSASALDGMATNKLIFKESC